MQNKGGGLMNRLITLQARLTVCCDGSIIDTSTAMNADTTANIPLFTRFSQPMPLYAPFSIKAPATMNSTHIPST
jgi:hypothetical protein